MYHHNIPGVDKYPPYSLAATTSSPVGEWAARVHMFVCLYCRVAARSKDHKTQQKTHPIFVVRFFCVCNFVVFWPCANEDKLKTSGTHELKFACTCTQCHSVYMCDQTRQLRIKKSVYPNFSGLVLGKDTRPITNEMRLTKTQPRKTTSIAAKSHWRLVTQCS